MLGNVAFFGCYYHVKQPLLRAQTEGRAEGRAVLGDRATTCVAGAAAGVGYWLCVFPLDACKTMIQAQDPHVPGAYRGLLHCARDNLQRHGVRRLYCGLGPCLLRAVPVAVTVFVIFEEVVPHMSKAFGVRDSPTEGVP